MEGKRNTQGVKARRQAKALLDSILAYVYGEAQTADDAISRDAFSLALATIGAARRDSSQPFIDAVFTCFGCSLQKHIERRAARQEFYASEFRDVSSATAASALAALTARASGLVDTTGSSPDAEPARVPTQDEPTARIEHRASRETADSRDNASLV